MHVMPTISFGTPQYVRNRQNLALKRFLIYPEWFRSPLSTSRQESIIAKYRSMCPLQNHRGSAGWYPVLLPTSLHISRSLNLERRLLDFVHSCLASFIWLLQLISTSRIHYSFLIRLTCACSISQPGIDTLICALSIS